MAKSADTVSICLSKGLGTPAGSVTITKRIRVVKKVAKMLEVGWGKFRYLVYAGIYALNNNVKIKKEDQDKAIYLAKELKRDQY